MLENSLIEVYNSMVLIYSQSCVWSLQQSNFDHYYNLSPPKETISLLAVFHNLNPDFGNYKSTFYTYNFASAGRFV